MKTKANDKTEPTKSGYRYLSVAPAGGVLRVATALPADALHLIPHRLRLVSRLFVRLMDRLGPLERVDDIAIPTFGFSLDRLEDIQKVARTLDMRFQDVFRQPLPAKLVDEILGISAAERRRWNKDGRLPSAGHIASGRTSDGFTLRVYSVDLIGRLMGDPTQIASWRQQDAQ